jgi:hypothetical protein
LGLLAESASGGPLATVVVGHKKFEFGSFHQISMAQGDYFGPSSYAYPGGPHPEPGPGGVSGFPSPYDLPPPTQDSGGRPGEAPPPPSPYAPPSPGAYPPPPPGSYLSPPGGYCYGYAYNPAPGWGGQVAEVPVYQGGMKICSIRRVSLPLRVLRRSSVPAVVTRDHGRRGSPICN